VKQEMKTYSEGSPISSMNPLFVCKKCRNACEVRVSNSHDNPGHEYYACYCKNGTNIFRAWCDKVHSQPIHTRQQFGRYENDMRDIWRATTANFMINLANFILISIMLCVVVAIYIENHSF
jgi:hypothetical protein